MSGPTYEIVKVVASDAYLADASVINEVAALLSKTPGFLGAWQGLDIHEPTHLWLIVAWETIEHHRTLMADKEKYPPLRAALQKAAKEMLAMEHVRFSGDFARALAAPVTELAVWTRKADADKAAFDAALGALVALLEGAAAKTDTDVCIAGAGAVVEDERKFVVGLGWPSLERFKAAVAAPPAEVVAKLGAVKQLGDVELKLVSLTKYPGA
ncbi:hypothetical protein PsYK624_043750 [Phanerochaete sordida]|uniref:ABM domain-containing protein n=1 Tax=Phanerochaete sordida TaxID=48140 RepID=A0A9P3G555_9APHY|nr:hypothetical protein PsYK624_043750 [Phanerochaete sordida]